MNAIPTPRAGGRRYWLRGITVIVTLRVATLGQQQETLCVCGAYLGVITRIAGYQGE